MWVKFMDVADGYSAEMWREIFSQEALSVRIVPALEVEKIRVPRELWIPDGKTHVAREVLNKI